MSTVFLSDQIFIFCNDWMNVNEPNNGNLSWYIYTTSIQQRNRSYGFLSRTIITSSFPINIVQISYYCCWLQLLVYNPKQDAHVPDKHCYLYFITHVAALLFSAPIYRSVEFPSNQHNERRWCQWTDINLPAILTREPHRISSIPVNTPNRILSINLWQLALPEDPGYWLSGHCRSPIRWTRPKTRSSWSRRPLLRARESPASRMPGRLP